MNALGPYEILHPAGSGGQATVWAARHVGSGVRVAVKIPKAGSFSADHEAELRALAAVQVPGVASLLDFGEVSADAAADGSLTAGAPYLVMEWASGGTLADQRLSGPELRDAVTSLLRALGHVHARGLLHLDLKPGNVLVALPGDLNPGLLLTDFGLTRPADGRGERPGGTPAFMAPEQRAGDGRRLGPWTDVYALGKTVLALLGDAPPDVLAPWLARATAADPRDRFATAAEALAAWSALPAFESAGAAFLADDRTLDLGTLDSLPEPAGLEARLHGGTAGLEARPHEGAPAVATRAGRLDVGHDPARPGPRPLLGTEVALAGLSEPPLQGREAEREALWAAVTAALDDGRPRAVVLRGPSGSGTSRLARLLAERAHHRIGARTIVHRGGDPDGYASLARTAARKLRLDGLEPAEAARHLAAAGEIDHERPIEAWLSALAPALTPAGPATPVVVALLARWITAGPPTILVLDDAHRDLAALQLASAVLQRAGPVVVVLAARSEPAAPEAEARLRALPAETLALEPLPMFDIAAILTGMMRIGRYAAHRIADVAEGNPGKALRALRGWVRAGALKPVQGGAVDLDPDVQPPPVETEEASWAAGVAPLDAAGRRAALLAGVMGEVGPRWRAAVAPDVAEAVLDALAAASCAVRAASGARLAHPAVAVALAAAAAADETPELHRLAIAALGEGQPEPRIGESVTGWVPDQPLGDGPTLARLARHHELAGEPERALVRLQQAAEAGVSHGVLVGVSTVLATWGALLDRLGVSPGDERRAHWLRYRILYARAVTDYGARDRALGELEEAIALHGWERWRPVAARHRMWQTAGRLMPSQAELHAVLALSERFDDPAQQARILVDIGRAMRMDRLPGDRLGPLRRAEALYAAIRDPVGLGMVKLEIGADRFDAEGREALTEARAWFERVGDRIGVWRCDYHLAYVELALEELDAALARAESAARLGRELLREANGTFAQAAVLVARGEFQRAMAIIGSEDPVTWGLRLAQAAWTRDWPRFAALTQLTAPLLPHQRPLVRPIVSLLSPHAPPDIRDHADRLLGLAAAPLDAPGAGG